MQVNPLLHPQELLAKTLAETKAFQTFLGVNTASEAAAKIHFNGLPPRGKGADVYSDKSLEEDRPYVVIYTEVEIGFSMSQVARGGTGNEFAAGGILHADFVRSLPRDPSDNIESIDTPFMRDMGNVIAGLAEFAGQPNYLNFTELEFSGPVHSAAKIEPTQGKYQAATLTFTWGHTVG